MIMFDKGKRRATKKIKIILEQANSPLEILALLEEFYERISNKSHMHYGKKYKLDKILESKTAKTFTRASSADEGVVIEIVEYKTAPLGYLIIYNEFEHFQQMRLEIFKEKEN